MKRLISITLVLILTLALAVTFAPTTVQAQGEPVVWSDPDLPSDSYSGFLHKLDTPFLANRFSGKSYHGMPDPVRVTLYDVEDNPLGTFTFEPGTEGPFEWEESLPGYWLIGSYESAPAAASIDEFKLYYDPPNTPPVAMDDAYTTNEETTLNVDAPGVLGNDDDEDSDPLTAVKVTDPTNGTLILNDDGSFTYNPATNFNGTDSFTYKANDGTNDSNIATVTITVNPLIIQVTLDIKPGSDPNSINLKSNGVVPVAVLTTDDFDAGEVNPESVEFACAMPERWNSNDVDGDGDLDLLFHFRTQELDLTEDSEDATLTGQTTDGHEITGTDSVRIVPQKGKK